METALQLITGKHLLENIKAAVQKGVAVVLDNWLLQEDLTIDFDIPQGLEIKSGDYREIVIKHCKFDSDIRIARANFGSITFENISVLNHQIIVDGGSFENAFVVKNCIIKHFYFAGGSFLGGIDFLESSIGYLNFQNLVNHKEIRISSGYYKSLSIKGDSGKSVIGDESKNHKALTIGSLEISLPLTARNNVVVNVNSEVLKINTISIADVGKDAAIRVFAKNVRHIYFDDSFIQGQLVFSGIRFTSNKYESIFSVTNSDLGKTQFLDCDFSNYKMIFRNSKISEIFLSGTAMPKVENINSYDNNNRQSQLALSQIKKTYENRGDRIEGGKYFADELNSHAKSLKWADGWSEKLVLFLNRFSNNHGQSWFRPLMHILAFGLVFFTLYCNLLGVQLFSLNTIFTNRIFLFLEFLNPLHKTEFLALKLGVPENVIPLKAIAFENISRIIITYFIYQFIQAFRKYGK